MRMHRYSIQNSHGFGSRGLDRVHRRVPRGSARRHPSIHPLNGVPCIYCVPINPSPGVSCCIAGSACEATVFSLPRGYCLHMQLSVLPLCCLLPSASSAVEGVFSYSGAQLWQPTEKNSTGCAQHLNWEGVYEVDRYRTQVGGLSLVKAQQIE